MEVNELRIGNYVSLSGELQLTVIEINTVYFYAKDNKGENFKSSWAEIKPIPLTEEWLLKFGFKKYIGWDDMEFWCLLNDGAKPNRFSLYETLQGFEAPSGKIIKEVHTLQNCYFFHELSGEELTIK